MAKLRVSRNEAEEILADHSSQGGALIDEGAKVTEQADYDDWRRDRSRWISLTDAALGYIYAGKERRDEFSQAFAHMVYVPRPWQDDFISDAKDVQTGINLLASLIERLKYDEPATGAQVVGDAPNGDLAIFLVHGHDTGTRETVARFLERTGPDNLRAVILDELANKGRTLLEKLEQHAGDAKYAVVLLTGDDVGGENTKKLNPRARQNVVLELGWFCGEIGRDNVAVLYQNGVERPSDMEGLVYIPLAGDWEKLLVRELCDAGWDFSLDRCGHRGVYYMRCELGDAEGRLCHTRSHAALERVSGRHRCRRRLCRSLPAGGVVDCICPFGSVASRNDPVSPPSTPPWAVGGHGCSSPCGQETGCASARRGFTTTSPPGTGCKTGFG